MGAKIKVNADCRTCKNYFDSIKRARQFANKNNSKVEIVNLDSCRRYLVLTVGRGIQ